MIIVGHPQHPCPIPITELLALARHPIDRPNSPEYSSMVAEARKELAEEGCAVIPQLLDSAALPIMSAEIHRIRPFLHESRIPLNPYFSEGDKGGGADEPPRRAHEGETGRACGATPG